MTKAYVRMWIERAVDNTLQKEKIDILVLIVYNLIKIENMERQLKDNCNIIKEIKLIGDKNETETKTD